MSFLGDILYNIRQDAIDARKNKSVSSYDIDDGDDEVVDMSKPSAREGYNIGTIKRYNDQKGYGFIRGEDGNDRFFHVSSVKSSEQPIQGAAVRFTPSQNERGLTAVDIYVKTKNASPAFIIFGDTRIKLSNINNYGISTETRYYQKVYEIEDTSSTWSRLVSSWVFKGKTVAITDYDVSLFTHNRQLKKYYTSGKSHFDQAGLNHPNTADKSDLITKKVKYLYVTTYQGDNFQFYEDATAFNINDKCSELDDLLS